MNLAIVDGLDVRDHRLENFPRRYNGAPSQELLVIRQNHKTGERTLEPLRWGLIPYWCKDPKGGRRPINAMAGTVHLRPMFREAYERRRCIVPIDGFFEWKAIKGKAKQPYAIAMRDGSPFGVAGLWELEKPFGRVGAHLRDRHHGLERIGRSNPRPHAGHPASG